MAKSKYTQRKDGRFATRVSTGKYTDDGKPIVVALYANSSADLDKLVRETRYELDHGSYIIDSGMIFGVYADNWMAVNEPVRSKRTNLMYENILKNHIDLLYHLRIKDIVKSNVQLQISARADHSRICEQILLTVNQICAAAIDDGLMLRNPCKGIKLPRSIPSEKRALTASEKQALKTANFTVREKAFIYLLYGCGLRPAEMYALTRADFDFENKELTINKALSFDHSVPELSFPKTNSGIRKLPLTDTTAAAVKEFNKVNPNFILFCNEHGKYMSRDSYYYVWECARNKINSGIELKEAATNLTQYTFRHNYCTELYYSGVSLKEAQRLMGHGDYSTVMRVYSHLDEKRENTLEKLQNALNF